MSNIAAKLYQRVRDALEEEIGRGSVGSANTLTETWVAKRFGISRGPARQALEDLQRRGLVSKAKGRGYLVSDQQATRPRIAGPEPVDTRFTDEAQIRFRPSWELIYNEIEAEIFARSSYASWRINEVALAKHFHVSRTVAHDVIARLQERGVILRDDRGKWYAPVLSAKHIDGLYELRWVLEPLALEKAAALVDAGLLAEMRQSLEKHIAAKQPIDSETLDALEHDLHVELLSYCDCKPLLQAIRMPQALLVAHHFFYRWTDKMFEIEPFLPEHLAIIAELEAGRVAQAKDALVDHLRVSRERTMMRIRSVAQTISTDAPTYMQALSPAADK